MQGKQSMLFVYSQLKVCAVAVVSATDTFSICALNICPQVFVIQASVTLRKYH